MPRGNHSNRPGRTRAKSSRLRFVRAVLEFGRSELGLDFAGSFEKFDSSRESMNWLYVSYPDEIESAIRRHSRHVPFKASWDIKYLRRSAAAYRGRGFDTYIFTAEGHGGGKCPITPALLASSPARRGYVVIHEGWHSTLRNQGVKIPYPLEEATGRVIGCFGIIQFAGKRADRELLTQALDQERDWALFANFINRQHKKLTKLYWDGGKNPARRKRELLEKAAAEAAKLRKGMKTDWERKELEAKLNNAFFLRYHDYTCYYPSAASLARSASNLREAAAIFKKLREEKDPLRALKRLARPRRAH